MMMIHLGFINSVEKSDSLYVWTMELNTERQFALSICIVNKGVRWFHYTKKHCCMFRNTDQNKIPGEQIKNSLLKKGTK